MPAMTPDADPPPERPLEPPLPLPGEPPATPSPLPTEPEPEDA